MHDNVNTLLSFSLKVFPRKCRDKITLDILKVGNSDKMTLKSKYYSKLDDLLTFHFESYRLGFFIPIKFTHVRALIGQQLNGYFSCVI